MGASHTPNPVRTLLICGAIVVTLSMGIRHTFGLFMQPMNQDLGWGREAFSLAIAVQNLLWGVAQPFSGWLADRYGAAKLILGGGLLYVLGLLLMTQAATPFQFILAAGVLIGLGLSGTTFSVVYGAVGRGVSQEKQASALALVGAAGSFGQFFMVPVAQQGLNSLGWLNTVLLFALLAASLLPLSFGVRDRGMAAGKAQGGVSTGEALREAFGHSGYLFLTLGFFVCGFQVVFIAAHLPAYLLDKGFSANLGMLALALIGLFNIFGTWSFGKLGGHYSKKNLLAGIYLARSVVIGLFLWAPLSSASVIVFACIIGFLWLGTVPLTNGLVARIFGVQYLSMLSGFVFFSHQVGSFLGVWLGGRVFDARGSYDLVWGIAIALGVVACLLNLPIREQPVLRAARPLT